MQVPFSSAAVALAGCSDVMCSVTVKLLNASPCTWHLIEKCFWLIKRGKTWAEGGGQKSLFVSISKSVKTKSLFGSFNLKWTGWHGMVWYTKNIFTLQ